MSEPIDRVYTGGCHQCKEPMWMERATYQTYKRNGKTFYCLHGHPQVFVAGKTEEQKLREQLDEERRQRQRAEQRVACQEDMRRRAERSAVAYKGQATKLRNRAKAGVCPCCNRTFKQLAAHMANKHPGFKKSPDADLPADVAPVLAEAGAQ